MKLKIKNIAIDHFNRDGYHGTTIRNIAKDAQCSLPMVNYYYKSKKELFYEIINTDYFELLNRQAAKLKINNDITSFYTDFIFNLNHLSDHEKKIYRLGIKVYLGFDGDNELVETMDKWQQSILPRHYNLMKPYLKGRSDDIDVVRALIRLLSNQIESIVVKGAFLPEDEIRRELSVVLSATQ
jgi:AcrR family transcriptional regulator